MVASGMQLNTHNLSAASSSGMPEVFTMLVDCFHLCKVSLTHCRTTSSADYLASLITNTNSTLLCVMTISKSIIISTSRIHLRAT